MTVLIDTHVALWMVEGDRRLGRLSKRSIERARHDEILFVSAVTFWEIGLLMLRGQLRTAVSAEAIRDMAIQAGIREAPLTGDIAMEAVRFAAIPCDPADAFIAATALRLDAILVTADRRMLDWTGPLKRHDAST